MLALLFRARYSNNINNANGGITMKKFIVIYKLYENDEERKSQVDQGRHIDLRQG